MTLVLDLDLNILKIYLHAKNEVSRSRLSKAKARTGQTQRDRRDWMHYHSAFVVAKTCDSGCGFVGGVQETCVLPCWQISRLTDSQQSRTFVRFETKSFLLTTGRWVLKQRWVNLVSRANVELPWMRFRKCTTVIVCSDNWQSSPNYKTRTLR